MARSGRYVRDEFRFHLHSLNSMVSVEINKRTVCPWTKQRINSLVRAVAKKEKNIRGDLEVNIIDDREMKKINRLYRGVNDTTDVLSFAWREDKTFETDFLGQIYLSYPRVKKQAKEFKVKVQEEFARMLIHGLLHLAGYDHQKKGQAKKMFDLQEKLLNKFFAQV